MQLKTIKFKWPIVNATSLDVTESRRSKWVMKSPARIFISVRPSNPRRLSTKRFAINDVVYRSARRAWILLARARLDRASPIPPPQSAEGPRAPTDRPLTRIWCQPRSPTRTRDVRRVAPCTRRNHDRTIARSQHGARSMRSGSRTRPRPPIDPHDRMHDGTSHCLERVQFSTTASATPTGATRGRHTQWSSRRLARSPTLLPVARPITTLHAHHNCTVASLELLRSLILI